MPLTGMSFNLANDILTELLIDIIYDIWVAVSTSPKNFKAGMRKFAFSAQHCSMPYLLLPNQGTTCQQNFSFKKWSNAKCT